MISGFLSQRSIKTWIHSDRNRIFKNFCSECISEHLRRESRDMLTLSCAGRIDGGKIESCGLNQDQRKPFDQTKSMDIQTITKENGVEIIRVSGRIDPSTSNQLEENLNKIVSSGTS